MAVQRASLTAEDSTAGITERPWVPIDITGEKKEQGDVNWKDVSPKRKNTLEFFLPGRTGRPSLGVALVLSGCLSGSARRFARELMAFSLLLVHNAKSLNACLLCPIRDTLQCSRNSAFLRDFNLAVILIHFVA